MVSMRSQAEVMSPVKNKWCILWQRRPFLTASCVRDRHVAPVSVFFLSLTTAVLHGGISVRLRCDERMEE